MVGHLQEGLRKRPRHFLVVKPTFLIPRFLTECQLCFHWQDGRQLTWKDVTPQLGRNRETLDARYAERGGVPKEAAQDKSSYAGINRSCIQHSHHRTE